jgi:hypothetical protein
MKISLTLIFAILIPIGFLLLGAYHEETHVAIYKNWGLDSHIEYFSHFPDFVTIQDSEGDCPDACQLAHSINESVGYHLLPVYIVFSFGLLCVMGILELLLERGEK